MKRRASVHAAALAVGLIVATTLLGAGVIAAAEEGGPAPSDDLAYTLLGRGYAVVMGYPADEVPGGDDGDDEEAEPAEPVPPQTCPEDQRGVPDDVAERLTALADPDRLEPLTAGEAEVPTPRGQPIKFDFGLADASLRSDPGSHAIAAFFYVDLGGGQDPWTSTEADGYASGHAREEERCGQPYFGRPGDASQVHVLSRAIEGPYAFAFNQTQAQQLPGGVSVRESVTVVEMEGRTAPVRATVTTVVSGVLAGPVAAEEVVTVLHYATDGTDDGTVVTGRTDVVGLEIGGTPVDLAPGAPPVAVGDVLIGIAAPEVRELDGGQLEITAGGLYVAGEFPNPLGLQAKQAVFIGGAWLDTSTSSFPPFPTTPPTTDLGSSTDTDVATVDEAAAPPPASGADFGAPAAGRPVTVGTAPAPDAGADAGADAVEAPAVAAREDAEPATALVASRRVGVYRAPPQIVGPLLVALAFLATAAFAGFVWARHRYPEIRAALGTPPFRWADTAYRAFLRG